MRPFGHQRPRRKVRPTSHPAGDDRRRPLARQWTPRPPAEQRAAQPPGSLRRDVRKGDSQLSSVASGTCQTPGYTLPARTRGHLPRRPRGPETTAVGRLPAEVQSGREAGRSAASNRGPAGQPRRLLSLTGSHFSRIRFPPNGFAVFLTLFSKYFSPFPHGTCSLSVSCQYLALDGVYHPLWAAFPNNPTLRRQWPPGPAVSRTGLSPSPTCLSRSTSTAPVRARLPLPATILRRPGHRGFQARAVPTSLAVTGGILVSFSSSAY